MPDTKINLLPEKSSITTTDLLHLKEVGSGSNDKKITFQNFVQSILDVVTERTVIEDDDYIAFETSTGDFSKILLTDFVDNIHKGLEPATNIDTSADDLFWSDGTKTYRGNSKALLETMVAQMDIVNFFDSDPNENQVVVSVNDEGKRMPFKRFLKFIFPNLDLKADVPQTTDSIIISSDPVAGLREARKKNVKEFIEESARLLDQGGTIENDDFFVVVKNEKLVAVTPQQVSPYTAPAGTVDFFAGETAPAGYLLANGDAVSRTDYAALFGVIGTNYGAGDGSTTFNLPDLRGWFPRFADLTAGVDPDTSIRQNRGDGVTGDAVGTKQPMQIQSHAHSIGSQTSAGGAGDNGRIKTPQGSATVGSTGGNETRPKNIALMGIIKY